MSINNFFEKARKALGINLSERDNLAGKIRRELSMRDHWRRVAANGGIFYPQNAGLQPNDSDPTQVAAIASMTPEMATKIAERQVHVVRKLKSQIPHLTPKGAN